MRRPCQHCREVRSPAARGLCYRCHADKAVRKLYPLARVPRCNLCREELPMKLNLPPRHRADRCPACQKLAARLTRAEWGETRAELTADQRAEVDARVEAMAALAGSRGPLFGGG